MTDGNNLLAGGLVDLSGPRTGDFFARMILAGFGLTEQSGKRIVA
jgi:hypothetical protein